MSAGLEAVKKAARISAASVRGSVREWGKSEAAHKAELAGFHEGLKNRYYV